MAQLAVAWGRSHAVLQLPQLEVVLSGVSQPLVELLSQLPQPAASAKRHSLTTVQWPLQSSTSIGHLQQLVLFCAMPTVMRRAGQPGAFRATSL